METNTTTCFECGTVYVGDVCPDVASHWAGPARKPILRNRDSRGRFQPWPMHIDRAMAHGCLFYDRSTRTTHSRNHCSEIRCPKSRLHRDGSTPSGWLCVTCVEVDGDYGVPDEPVSKFGSALCPGCDVWLPVTKFPTTHLSGVGYVRDDRVCRSCRKNGVHVTGELGFDSIEIEHRFGRAARGLDPIYRPDLRVLVGGSWVFGEVAAA